MHNKILELIENVSPDDTDTLNEIDVRVSAYVDARIYDEKLRTWFIDGYIKWTRSRDALKAIRPEGWYVLIHTFYLIEKYKAWGTFITTQHQVISPNLPTEELAELHAIIQAIAWGRDDEKENKQCLNCALPFKGDGKFCCITCEVEMYG